MVNLPVIVPKEIEVVRLKKVVILLVIFASLMIAVTTYIYMHESLHLIVLPTQGFNIAHIWMYSIFTGISILLGMIAIYSRRVPSLRMLGGVMSPAFLAMLLGFLVSVSLIGVNEILEIWFAGELFPALNFPFFNVALVPMMVGTLSYMLRVYSKLVELGAETPPRKPYVAELYLLELERKKALGTDMME